MVIQDKMDSPPSVYWTLLHSCTRVGAGTFAFAPLAAFLVSEFGWKGANFIFAGLCLNCCVFGALMKPLELVIQEPPEENGEMTLQLPDGTRSTAQRGSESSGHRCASGRKVTPTRAA